MITLGARVILKVIELAELSPEQQKAVADYFDLNFVDEIARTCRNA